MYIPSKSGVIESLIVWPLLLNLRYLTSPERKNGFAFLNKKSVFIVLNRKLQKREVNIVTRFDDRYLINGNIKNGEIMVVTDVSSLSDDQEVLKSKKQN